MPKRKRVVIKASEWGPDTLLSSRTGKMCCQGFACLALGKTESEITDVETASNVDVSTFDIQPSESLQTSYVAMGIHPAGHVPYETNVECIIANANDNYFARKITLDDALPIIRQGFREAGLTLVYRADL